LSAQIHTGIGERGCATRWPDTSILSGDGLSPSTYQPSIFFHRCWSVLLLRPLIPSIQSPVSTTGSMSPPQKEAAHPAQLIQAQSQSTSNTTDALPQPAYTASSPPETSPHDYAVPSRAAYPPRPSTQDENMDPLSFSVNSLPDFLNTPKRALIRYHWRDQGAEEPADYTPTGRPALIHQYRSTSTSLSDA
jgi:hypothetical protein